MSRVFLGSIALLLIVTATVSSAFAAHSDRPTDDLIAAALEYQAALARLLELQQADLDRARADIPRKRELAALGLIARRDVADAEQRTEWLALTVDKTRAEIARAETLVIEARAATAPRLAPGEERRAADHIAFGGGSAWSLGRVAAIERFFAARFHRSLPVSAYGQTSLHDRLGFDHRTAIDVAIHPDTPEGRALLSYLRAERIPFIAFRGAEPGASTGAHVHIGEPSPRRAAFHAEPRPKTP
jgi:hypothetical protein